MKKIAFLAALFLLAEKGLAQNTFYRSTARQKTEMDTIFPFDVPLRRADSSAVSSADLLKKGRPTVLAFWLTTCFPCRLELGEYLKNWEAWKTEIDFDLVAISTDFPRNWQPFVERSKEYPWPTVVDFNREFSQFLPGGLNGLPQVFLFDKNGTLVFRKKGFRLGDETALFEEIKKL